MRVILVGAHHVVGDPDMRRLDVELRVSVRSLLRGNSVLSATIAVEGVTPHIEAAATVHVARGGLALSLDTTLDDGRPLRLAVHTDLRRPSTRSLSELSGELTVGPPGGAVSRAVLRADVFHESWKWGGGGKQGL
jgi:hypothetical protein